MTSRAQQMAAAQTQALSLPVDTTIIHVNRKLNVSDSGKNNEVKYRLVDPIQVRKGDTVELYEAFLNVRGQNTQTININDDITTTIWFNYYVPNDVFHNASLDGDFQSIYNQIRSTQYKQCPDHKADIFTGIFPTEPGGGVATAQLYTALQDSDRAMPQGAPLIMGAIENYGYEDTPSTGDTGQQTVNFRVGTATITIPAGNYDVTALSELVTEQLNGNIIDGNQFKNILFDNRDEPIPVDSVNAVANDSLLFRIQHTSETGKKYGSFAQLTANEPNCTYSAAPNDPPDDAFYCFWDLQTFNKIKDRCVDFYENGNPGNKYGTAGSYNFFNLDEATTSFANLPGETAGAVGYTEFLGLSLSSFPEYDVDADVYPDYCLVPRNMTKDNLPETVSRDETYNTINSVMTINSGMSPAVNGGLGGAYQCVAGTTMFAGTYYVVEGSNGPAANANNSTFIIPPTADQKTALTKIARTTNGRFIGTKSCALTFNGGSVNRFAFSNFHEPYRVPTISQGLQNPSIPVPVAENVGGAATKMIFGGEHPSNQDLYNAKRTQETGVDLRRLCYNVEASSGVSILGFAFEEVKKTAKWLELIALYNAATDIQLKRCYYFLTYNMPWDWYFPTTKAAENAWAGTLWAQLGFNYSDIGNITSRQESYYTQASWWQAIRDNSFDNVQQYRMPGLISHNEASLSLATSLNCLGNVIEVDTSGTGSGNDPTNLSFQTFDTMGSFLNVPSMPLLAPVSATQNYNGEGTIGENFNVIGVHDFAAIPQAFAVVPVIADPQYVVGSSYPNLANDSSYFIIESDIVQGNYLDPEGSKKTVIGFVSKRESVADTLFSTGGIPLTFKQDKLINEIGIRVTNTDGTDVSNAIINSGSGFIFILTRNSNEIGNYLAVAEEMTDAAEEGASAAPEQ